MSDFLGMFDSEKKEQLAALREVLEADKKRVADELTYYKSVAKDIKKAKKRVESAQAAYDKRESEKNASKLQDATDELSAAIGSFQESEGQIRLLLDTVQADYSNIADMYRGRKSSKIMEAFEKYSGSVLSRIIDIQTYAETDGLESEEEEENVMPIPEIPVATGTLNPAAPQPAAPAAPAAQPAPAYAHPGTPYQYPQYIPVPMPMPYSYPPQSLFQGF